MNTIIVTDQNRGCYGQLLDQQFRQRRELFIAEMDWDIPHTQTIEADQYDRVDTVYILVEEQGRLVGYSRLLSTAGRARFGMSEFSYMVRDAVLGMLPGIPTDIMGQFVPPSSEAVWEMTRVQASNRSALTRIFRAAAPFLISKNVTHTITYTRKSFASILDRLGYKTTQLGPSYEYSNKDYCVLLTELSEASGLLYSDDQSRLEHNLQTRRAS